MNFLKKAAKKTFDKVQQQINDDHDEEEDAGPTDYEGRFNPEKKALWSRPLWPATTKILQPDTSHWFLFAGKTPFTWSQGDKHQFLEVIGNGQDVSYSGRYHEQVEDDNLGPSVR